MRWLNEQFLLNLWDLLSVVIFFYLDNNVCKPGIRNKR